MAHYEKVLADLEQSLEFCRSLGLDRLARRGRFAEHRKRIAELISLIQQGPLPELPPHVVERLQEGEISFATALVEALEFSEALQELRHLDPDRLRKKLEVILTGPPLPITENASSTNAPRNTLFELYLASRLAAGGLPVELGEHPDLTCRIGEIEVLIECKRPYSPAGVEGAIKEASHQLTRELESRQRASFGVIAISVSKVLNPGDLLFTYTEETRAVEALSRTMQEITKQKSVDRALQEVAKQAKIVGALFHVNTVALDRTAERFNHAIQINAHIFDLGRQAFLRLGETIARGAKYVGATGSS